MLLVLLFLGGCQLAFDGEWDPHRLLERWIHGLWHRCLCQKVWSNCREEATNVQYSPRQDAGPIVKNEKIIKNKNIFGCDLQIVEWILFKNRKMRAEYANKYPVAVDK